MKLYIISNRSYQTISDGVLKTLIFYLLQILMNVTQALISVNQVKTSDVEICQGIMSVFVNQTTTRSMDHVRKVTIIKCFEQVHLV